VDYIYDLICFVNVNKNDMEEMKMAKIKVEGESPAFSFKGWDIWKFIEGRKKLMVTIIAAALGYIITNNEIIAILSAPVGEMLYGILEYYFKER
jgi:hypothetical protein